MRKRILLALFSVLIISQVSFAQERAILVPRQVEGAPFKYTDGDDLFGQAYRWFFEGDVENAGATLRKLVTSAGVKIDPNAYYVVVANFTDNMSPIGMFHGSDDFLSTRMYGLGENNLYYVFITRQQGAESFLSVLATSKDSPFMENLIPFIGLFVPLATTAAADQPLATKETWIDVRQFKIPDAFRKFSDLSFLVKKDLSDEKILARMVLTTPRWSAGVLVLQQRLPASTTSILSSAAMAASLWNRSRI